MNKISGFLYGILSSSSFGLIPLFTLPLMQWGMNFESILIYRYLFACLAIGGLLVLNKQSLKIRRQDLLPLLFLALLYNISSVFLFWGYKLMPSGVATTIHFMYPVFTTLLMMLLFKEKRSNWRVFAIILAILGVFALSYSSNENNTISPIGLLIVLISAFGYGSYLVTLSQLKIKLNGLHLTFYVFLFAGIILTIGTFFYQGVQPIETLKEAKSLILLALIPTTVSNLALLRSVKSIGSTLTSVLGTMEPVTAVCVGIAVFGELFTVNIGIGILLIISAVTLIIVKR